MARPRQISDEQILEATKRLVLAHGPHVSLEVVAHDLGVTSPALLKRFGSRQELWLKALMPPADGEVERVIFVGPDDRPLVKQLEDLFARMAEEMGKIIPCMAALRESGIDLGPLHQKTHGPMRSLAAMSRWLEAAKQKGLVTVEELETAASAINGAAMSRIMMGHFFRQHYSQRSQSQHFKELASLFSRALAPESKPSPSPVHHRGHP